DAVTGEQRDLCLFGSELHIGCRGRRAAMPLRRLPEALPALRYAQPRVCELLPRLRIGVAAVGAELDGLQRELTPSRRQRVRKGSGEPRRERHASAAPWRRMPPP